MIKNIIKRVIVGVLIALILGAIGSCEVKALSKQMTNTGATWYDQTNMISTTSSNITWNGVPYWQVLTANSVQMTQPMLVFTGVSPSDGTSNIYAKFDYLSFVVYSNVVQPSGAVLSALDIPCTATVLGNTGLVNGSNQNFSIIECNISNIASLNSTQIDILFNQRATSSYTYAVRVQSDFYFYNEPISDDLQTIINKLDISIDKYDDLISLITTSNSKLTSVVNKLTTLIEKLESSTITITNAQQQTTQSVNDMNDTIKDDDTSNVSTDSLSSASGNVASNNVISNLVLLPVNLFTKILNSTSASCTPFNLGTLYEEELILPCINLSEYLGSTLFNVIDILISGLFIYHISRKMVKVFEELSSLRTGGNEV